MKNLKLEILLIEFLQSYDELNKPELADRYLELFNALVENYAKKIEVLIKKNYVK